MSEIYFIVVVMLASQILSNKIAEKQSRVLWIHEIIECFLFYFKPNLIFLRKQNNTPQHMTFKPMFLKVKQSDFSEIPPQGT